ncbi:hypothetical protein CBW46_018490 [Paenibacillus xerothermodurans]|uniref:Uncharacterized protein n=1 Tax=Paenibacillus xerothermodurans TaxID=1977292 RepID=A0A2W1N3V6_PAEXE|nr:hypothetical protein CBW46_018490 [Paenibacillus xerothermodurans]
MSTVASGCLISNCPRSASMFN